MRRAVLPHRRSFGILCLAVGLAMGWANLALPWLVVPAEGGPDRAFFRSDLLAQDPIPYEWTLLWAPLAAAAVAALAGLVLAVPGPTARARPVALGGAAVAGFLFLLCGARWVGFGLARRLEPGVPLPSPPLPWLDLAAGVLLAGGALAAARPPRLPHPAQRIGAVAAALLVALPLLPLAVRGDGFHFDEFSLEQARTLGSGGTPAAAAWAVRWMLVALVVVGCTAGWPPLGSPRARRVLRGATLLAGGLALLLAALFYMDAGSLQGARPWPSPFLPLTGPLLMALAAWPRMWMPAPRGGSGRQRVISPSPKVPPPNRRGNA